MSPILVRPVREQLEHDRVIRLLQAKYKRKFEVAINPGNEQTAPVGPTDVAVVSGSGAAVLGAVRASWSAWSRSRPSESVNHLEAMSQWKTFSSLNVQFHLYVPASGVDSARRLCARIIRSRPRKSGPITRSAIRFASRPCSAHRKPADGKGRPAIRDARTGRGSGQTGGSRRTPLHRVPPSSRARTARPVAKSAGPVGGAPEAASRARLEPRARRHRDAPTARPRLARPHQPPRL